MDIQSQNNQQDRSASSIKNSIIQTMMLEFGLRNAVLYGMWLSSCSNFTSMLSVACGLIASDRHRSILMIIVDRVMPGQNRRFQNGLSVLGDGGVCCLISRERADDLETPECSVNVVLSISVPELLQLRGSNDIAQRGRKFLSSCKRLSGEFLKHSGQRISDYKNFIGDNFHSSFYEIVEEGLQIANGSIHLPTKAIMGHVSSCDILSNISYVIKTNKIRPGDGFLALNFGPVLWGAIDITINSE
ncbi:hypothetical protein KXS07_02375 [Inquilinus limosus]|uniref:hypothetical protein n=1 Tax=Inquilinus limosus TaxID=171674 RepID=UPI003F175275